MNLELSQTYTAFSGHRLLAHGRLDEVVLTIKWRIEAEPGLSVLAFSDTTGKEMDFDLRGSEAEVLQRLKPFLPRTEEPASTGPGRPRLGVVAREVSLLPRHWEWLSTQPGGASATLRRLVDEARKQSTSQDHIRQGQDAAYRFMSSVAGNLPQYEEAIRALYARDEAVFRARIDAWPEDVKAHAWRLAEPALRRG